GGGVGGGGGGRGGGGKKRNAGTSTRQPAARCESRSAALTPPIAASATKPPTRISDTRLEMVMVRRSLEAANAIIAGNSASLRASATMITVAARALTSTRPR